MAAACSAASSSAVPSDRRPSVTANSRSGRSSSHGACVAKRHAGTAAIVTATWHTRHLRDTWLNLAECTLCKRAAGNGQADQRLRAVATKQQDLCLRDRPILKFFEHHHVQKTSCSSPARRWRPAAANAPGPHWQPSLPVLLEALKLIAQGLKLMPESSRNLGPVRRCSASLNGNLSNEDAHADQRTCRWYAAATVPGTAIELISVIGSKSSWVTAPWFQAVQVV